MTRSKYSLQRQLWLSAAVDSEGEIRDVEADVFGVSDRELLMPSFVVAGNLTLGQVHDKIPGLKEGAVALGYGSFWIIWETDACLITEEEDEAAFDHAAYARTLASGKIIDMHGGCLRLDAAGEWVLLGAS